MAETRLEKYKKYRESIKEVKETSKDIVFEEARRSRVVTDTTNTTSTLPIEEVLGKIEEENEVTSVKFITKKKIQIAILVLIGVLLIAGIIVFAIFAFGGTN